MKKLGTIQNCSLSRVDGHLSQVDHYWGNRSNLFIAPSIRDSMRRSAYARSNQRDEKEKAGPEFGYDDPKKIAELTGKKGDFSLFGPDSTFPGEAHATAILFGRFQLSTMP